MSAGLSNQRNFLKNDTVHVLRHIKVCIVSPLSTVEICVEYQDTILSVLVCG